MPPHPDQRLGGNGDAGDPGGAEQQIVVLGVTARNVLVDQSDPFDKRGPMHQPARRMDLGHPVLEEAFEGQPVGPGHPGGVGTFVADEDAGAGGPSAAVGGQGLELGLELARQPLVVVVTEGDPGIGGHVDPAVPGPGQTRRALVGGDDEVDVGTPLVGRIVDQGRIGFGPIEHDDDLDRCVVALGPHRRSPDAAVRDGPGWR